MVELQNFEVFIILQKCPQEIGLIPGPALFNPCFCISIWVNPITPLEGSSGEKQKGLVIMQTMDTIRSQWNLKCPNE